MTTSATFTHPSRDLGGGVGGATARRAMTAMSGPVLMMVHRMGVVSWTTETLSEMTRWAVTSSLWTITTVEDSLRWLGVAPGVAAYSTP